MAKWIVLVRDQYGIHGYPVEDADRAEESRPKGWLLFRKFGGGPSEGKIVAQYKMDEVVGCFEVPKEDVTISIIAPSEL